MSQTIAGMKTQCGTCRPVSAGKLDIVEISGKAKPRSFFSPSAPHC